MNEKTIKFLKWLPLNLFILTFVLNIGLALLGGGSMILLLLFPITLISCIVSLSLKSVRTQRGAKAISISVGIIVIVIVITLLGPYNPPEPAGNCMTAGGVCIDTNEHSSCQELDRDYIPVAHSYPCTSKNEICCVKLR